MASELKKYQLAEMESDKLLRETQESRDASLKELQVLQQEVLLLRSYVGIKSDDDNFDVPPSVATLTADMASLNPEQKLAKINELHEQRKKKKVWFILKF